MYSLVLAIIYISFISLGLPDSLIGSGWPDMHKQLDVPISYAGIITMIIAGSTILSSLMSDRLTKKFGAGLVTAFSVLLTALALLGFSFSGSFIMLCVLAIPYGLGAGAVDASINNYAAIHYSSKHMNWLHCCWGVGASISPYIMSYSLTRGLGWQSGYFTISVIQFVLCLIIFLSVPLWKKNKIEQKQENTKHENSTSLASKLKIRGVKYILVTFFCYCAIESTAGLWASSYLIEFRNIPLDVAASFAALFYLGITVGRFLCGFVSDKIGNKNIIYIGIGIIFFGIALIILPVKLDMFALCGLVVAGFGCAPIYPAVIHSTPTDFGEENSQAIIGIQMASAYAGSTFMPPIFGLISDKINISLYPFYLLALVVLMLFMFNLLNKSLKKVGD